MICQAPYTQAYVTRALNADYITYSASMKLSWENLPEIEGGDEYLSPLNMTPVDKREHEKQ